MLKITREYIMNMIIYCVGVLSAGGQGINASPPPPLIPAAPGPGFYIYH